MDKWIHRYRIRAHRGIFVFCCIQCCPKQHLCGPMKYYISMRLPLSCDSEFHKLMNKKIKTLNGTLIWFSKALLMLPLDKPAWVASCWPLGIAPILPSISILFSGPPSTTKPVILTLLYGFMNQAERKKLVDYALFLEVVCAHEALTAHPLHTTPEVCKPCSALPMFLIKAHGENCHRRGHITENHSQGSLAQGSRSNLFFSLLVLKLNPSLEQKPQDHLNKLPTYFNL